MKKAIALFMSFLLLGSQVGFSVAIHYCGGEISDRSISIIEEKVSCGMESLENDCPSMAYGISEKSCCEDESSVYQLDEDFQKKLRSFEVETEFLAVFAAHYFLLFDKEETIEDYTKLPPPPLIQQNNQVLYQTFLL